MMSEHNTSIFFLENAHEMSTGIMIFFISGYDRGPHRYVGSSCHYVGSFDCYVGGILSGERCFGLFQFLPLFPHRKKSSALILRGISRFFQDHIVRSDRFSIGDEPLVCEIIDQPACAATFHGIVRCSVPEGLIARDENGIFRSREN